MVAVVVVAVVVVDAFSETDDGVTSFSFGADVES